MKRQTLLALLMLPSFAHAQTAKGLERLNFFPDADAFFLTSYQYRRFSIETPRAAVQTKAVNNYYNVLALTYGHRLGRKMFAGTVAELEQASENAVTYGIPLKRRFNSFGPREPELFILYRLKQQKEDIGLYDLRLSYAPMSGRREVGHENANRLRGRDQLEIRLSHGLWEEEWEFRTSLRATYHSEGKEQNSFNRSSVRLGSYYTVNFQFAGQYRFHPKLFGFGSAGIVYTGTETVREPAGEKRQILSGTGSVFELGLKKPLGDKALLEASYSLQRNEYFVKSPEDNLEGQAHRQVFTLMYRLAF